MLVGFWFITDEMGSNILCLSGFQIDRRCFVTFVAAAWEGKFIYEYDYYIWDTVPLYRNK